MNIGDGLTRWTDGLLKSTYHRVRAPKQGDPMVSDVMPFVLADLCLFSACMSGSGLCLRRSPPCMQGARWSIPYFVNPKLNFVIQVSGWADSSGMSWLHFSYVPSWYEKC